MTSPGLPDYENPPVDEIVAAVQFSPWASFRIPEIVLLNDALQGWTLIETPPAVEPIVETAPGEPAVHRFGIGFGMEPVRAIFNKADAAWQLQVQHDRIALSETRGASRPSSKRVLPKLQELVALVSNTLDTSAGQSGPQHAELVELIYVNRIDGNRGFKGWDCAGDTFLGVAPHARRSRSAHLEAMQVAWAFPLDDGSGFEGRLRAELGPTADGAAQFNLNSRRYLRGRDTFEVLEMCHRDIVIGFDDMTTDAAHDVWGKLA